MNPGIVILILGIILCLLGLILIFIQIKMLAKCTKRTAAVIHSLKKQSVTVRGSKMYSYIPEITYTYDGKEYVGEASFSTSNKDKYKPGDTLTIFVNPSNPENFRFRGKFGAFIFGALCLIAGTALVILFVI